MKYLYFIFLSISLYSTGVQANSDSRNNYEQALAYYEAKAYGEASIVLRDILRIDFSVEGLGLDPVLPGEFNYAFSGSWDISNVLGGHGLSNFELWARDPVVAQVTEPSTLALMLLSGGFIYLRRRKFK